MQGTTASDATVNGLKQKEEGTEISVETPDGNHVHGAVTPDATAGG